MDNIDQQFKQYSQKPQNQCRSVFERQGWSGRKGRLCQRCEGSSVDDVEHMIFDCSSLEAERQKHQFLFARGRVDLADLFEQDPIELAIVHGCFKACNEEQDV